MEGNEPYTVGYWADLSVVQYVSGHRDFGLIQRLFSWVESAISDPVRLLASMASIRCVFHQLATRGVKKLLGKLAVGGITLTKTKTDIPTWNTFHTRITGCSIVFQRNMFPNICKHSMVFLCFMHQSQTITNSIFKNTPKIFIFYNFKQSFFYCLARTNWSRR